MALIKNKIFYTYNDITIIPCELSDIEHRSECIPLDENGMLPLFTAPMDTVVNEKNFPLFENELINAILPRTEDLNKRVDFSVKNRWAAYSLSEFEKVFCNEETKLNPQNNKIKALIDVANGHMKKILDLVRAARNIYGDDIVIMAGNIANPLTYRDYAEVGIDYCRVSVGTGACCITSTQLGIHYPIASLIDDMVEVKRQMEKEEHDGIKKYKRFPKIIADGGTRNYCDIIKALALGADYVMCGSIFSKMLESPPPKVGNGEDFYHLPIDVTVEDLKNVYHDNIKNAWYGYYNNKKIFLGNLYCKIYGMASKEGQIALNGSKTKTSEGKSRNIEVEYTMHTWAMNFMDYIRSAMSYLGARTLKDLNTFSTLIINSQNAVSAVNK